MEQTPLSLLSKTILKNRPIIIFIRNNRKLLGYLRAYDKHLNLILENVKELRTNVNFGSNNNFRERFFSKMILRGDSIVVIVPV